MKKFKLMLACVAMLGLSACNTGDVAAEIAQIQAYAKQACSYVPTAATVLDIIASATGNASLQSVSQIAEAICGAVASKSARRGGGVPTVNGVVVHGHFVR